MYIHTQTLQQLSERDIRALFPNVAFPHPFVPPSVYAYIFPAPSNHDPATQTAVPAAPELTVLGTWEQRWTVAPRPPGEVAAEAAQALRNIKVSQIVALETVVTPRRIREALLTAEGKTWLTSIDAQIAALRV